MAEAAPAEAAAGAAGTDRAPWGLAGGAALLVCVGAGFRPFPAVDDFLYVPTAWARLDPTWLPRDFFVRHAPDFTPAWTAMAAVAEWAGGWPAVGRAATVVLTLATVLGLLGVVQALGARGWLLPLALLPLAAGRFEGLGRGAFEGLIGAGFHPQWLALALVLWTYVAFARRRPVTAGVLLGLGMAAHPLVGAHGALVVTLATPWTGAGGLGRLWRTGLAAAVVAAPVWIPVLGSLGGGGPSAIADARLLEEAYWLRVPHEFSLPALGDPDGRLLFLIVGAGLAGLAAAWSGRDADRAVLGLLLGHLALVAAAAALYADPATGADPGPLFAYRLHLTRTSPLLMGLCLGAAAAGLEGALRERRLRGAPALAALGAAAAGLTLLAFDVRWSAALVPLTLAGCGGLLAVRMPAAGPTTATAAIVAGIALLPVRLVSDPARAELPPEVEHLHAWARDSTPRDALFVVPPGAIEFRWGARRSVYVDFKSFPTGFPEAAAAWRRRLALVAAPDPPTRRERGWPALPLWDRSYAHANGPSRAARLLERTGADYLVWDARGLAVPPFLAPDHRPDPRIVTAFANRRFRVWTLAEAP